MAEAVQGKQQASNGPKHKPAVALPLQLLVGQDGDDPLGCNACRRLTNTVPTHHTVRQNNMHRLRIDATVQQDTTSYSVVVGILTKSYTPHIHE
jgi:hypothetical protein